MPRFNITYVLRSGTHITAAPINAETLREAQTRVYEHLRGLFVIGDEGEDRCSLVLESSIEYILIALAASSQEPVEGA